MARVSVGVWILGLLGVGVGAAYAADVPTPPLQVTSLLTGREPVTGALQAQVVVSNSGAENASANLTLFNCARGLSIHKNDGFQGLSYLRDCHYATREPVQVQVEAGKQVTLTVPSLSPPDACAGALVAQLYSGKSPMEPNVANSVPTEGRLPNNLAKRSITRQDPTPAFTVGTPDPKKSPQRRKIDVAVVVYRSSAPSFDGNYLVTEFCRNDRCAVRHEQPIDEKSFVRGKRGRDNAWVSRINYSFTYDVDNHLALNPGSTKPAKPDLVRVRYVGANDRPGLGWRWSPASCNDPSTEISRKVHPVN